jgi:hypothetical protein
VAQAEVVDVAVRHRDGAEGSQEGTMKRTEAPGEERTVVGSVAEASYQTRAGSLEESVLYRSVPLS